MWFKSIDEKFRDIGFVKVYENDSIVSYEREIEEFEYTHCLDLSKKISGNHLIQSYQKGTNNDGFNNVVGLTMYESKLAIKKMKQKGFKHGK